MDHMSAPGRPHRSSQALVERSAAYTLKGMRRNICAGEAADLAEHLESSIGLGDWIRAEQELGDLESLIRRTLLELRMCAEYSSESQ
jgi:hypothetical protein